MNPQDIILAYLISSQMEMKSLLKPFIEQRDGLLKTQDSIFHGDVHNEFHILAKQTMAIHMSKALGLSIEEIYSVLEPLDVDAYLSV